MVDASRTLTGGSEGIVEGELEDVVGDTELEVFNGSVEELSQTLLDVVVVNRELVVVGDVVPGTELVDSGTEDDTKLDDGVTVVVVLGTVEVVEVVDVVVVEVVVVDVGGVVVVVDDVGELVVDVTVVGVSSLVVVTRFHNPSVLSSRYGCPHHLSGSPQHTPARNRYVPGSKLMMMRDCNEV